jgi:transposase
MLTMPAAPPLSLTDDQRAALERLSRSTSARHRTVQRAKALLLAADGEANYEIARRVGVSANSVRTWRARFTDEGVEGIDKIAPGRGRKSWLPEGTVAAVVHDTMHATPDDGSTHWTTRLMAKRHGIGKDSVARIWRDHKLKPWRVERFKVSKDPRFEEKIVDVVALYLNPPERAAVFCFDEKTQVQALDRTQPSLPMTPGRAGTMTHDYKRNGTTDLFAALNVGTGEVLTDCRKHHKGVDVLRFFKLIDLHVDKDLDIHVILDNLSAHRSPEVKKWLADPKRARWHLHFIPTSSSWLNLVERWFKELTDRRLRRGTFTSVANLVDAIETWVEHWNDDPKPFVWHKTAEEIITKVRRGRAALAQVKSATHD